MAFLVDNAWLAAAVPFGIGLLVWAFGRAIGKGVAWLAMLAPATLLAVGGAAAASMSPSSAGSEHAAEVVALASGHAPWIALGDTALTVGWALDGLTAVMLLVVGVVALMVMVFSIGYMAEDRGFTRYYALLCLFAGSMTVLVLADGFAGLFVGWELVGASSYLLIGFWYRKPSAAAAAVKAFLTTRVGDIGLLLGIALLWQQVGSLAYGDVFEAVPGIVPAMLTTVALLLLVGAVGKSAQFPLHIWLPDAMEGPTPVSALIHAATMVAAGVFLIARAWPVFEPSETARAVVLVVGAVTALMAATIALVQTDIKRVLAYSTISQLGFMFAALGAGAPIAAMFHLVTHAAFKALLFLGSGSVIHGSHTQDMREMGGLRRTMPYTMATWVVGSAALAGIPPLAGFFSKDEVLHAVMDASPVAGVALFAASLLTAFYITRATSLTFLGEYRGSAHPHESGGSMLVPLFVLALPALALGFAASRLTALLGEASHGLDTTVALVSSGIALLGVGAALAVYGRGTAADTAFSSRMGGLHTLLARGYFIDDAVSAWIVRPVAALASALYRSWDVLVVDGFVEGVGSFTSWVGNRVRGIQIGDAQWYGSIMAAGFVLLFVAVTLMGGR